MNLSMIRARLCEPWLITAGGKQTVRGVYETALATGKAERVAAALEARDGAPFANERDVQMVNGIPVITINGPLMRKAELFSDISGATSYEWIGAQCDKVRGALDVRSAVIRFNTPGGEAAGCGICGDKIRALAAALEARGGELVGYVETQASSGGLWLVAQCSRIVAHEQARTGSLGVRFVLTDDAERDAKAGVKEHEIISDGSEGKRGTPVDSEVLGRVQVLANDIFAVFLANVASGRDVSTAAALKNFGGGDELIAAKALAAGLIDEIGDLDSILARLGGGANNQGARMNPSTASASSPGSAVASTLDAAPDPTKCATCNEPMHPDAKAHCNACYAKAGAPDEDDDEDAKAAVAFRTRALALVGESDPDKALGLFAAHRAAAAELAALRAGEATAAANQARADVLASVESAVARKRLTLGTIGEIAVMVDDPARAAAIRTSLDAAAGDRTALLAALTAQTWTPAEATRIGYALGNAPPALPAPHREPPDTEEHVLAAAIDPAQARKFGLDPERVAALINVNSVADLPRRPNKGA